MPETKEETLAEIERLTEWCEEMYAMITTDGTVPDSMYGVYHRQARNGHIRLEELKRSAVENGWMDA